MIPAPDYNEISRHWQSRTEESHNYEIISNHSVFRAGFSYSSIFESEYREMQALKSGLVEQYQGQDIGEVFNGEPYDTPDGSSYLISTPVDMDRPVPPSHEIREKLLQDLTLVKGIGPVKAGLLKKRGYHTIRDLLCNRSYRDEAQHCAEVIGYGGAQDVMDLVLRWHSPSHPYSVLGAGLYGCKNLLFIDLETLGFFSRPVILFGIAEYADDRLVVKQFLVLDMAEEISALQAVADYFGKKAVIVSFNGKTFDLPYLQSRSAYYGYSLEIPDVHLDLLHASRRSFGKKLNDCRLKTIEQQILNIHRDIDIPGSMVPEFYQAYQRTGSLGPLIPIVEHNREDIITLARLLALYSRPE